MRGEGIESLSSLDSASIKSIRAAIRTRMKTEKAIPDFVLTALINLGDTNAMREAVDLRTTNNAFAGMMLGETLQAKCDQPEFLPYLASEVMTEEPYFPWLLEDIGIERVSVDSARIMRQILVRSHAFPEEVRLWATSLNIRNRAAIRDTMRKWWQLNNDCVGRKEYGKAVVVAPIESDK